MIDERIQQLIIGLIFKSSIYGFILSMCRLQPDENVPHVMWVSFDRECNPILGYNPIRTQELEAKEIMMIFKHECFHLANNHITRGNKLFDMYSTYFQNQRCCRTQCAESYLELRWPCAPLRRHPWD